jgi:hypothetical protein
MNPASILTGELVTAERALDRASRSLDALGDAGGSELLTRVRGRFDNQLEGSRDKCRGLRQRIEQGASVEAGWSELEILQREISDLLGECLAFVEGALARRSGFDGGICKLADSMLDALSRKADIGWQRFTLVAAGEFYSTLSGIVRLRFTDTDIWSLPVCVHEFGHFAASTQQFAEFGAIAAREKQKDTRYDSHLRELFSDIFATYALGPSLAIACALLRFVPSTGETQTHPSNAERLWCMLQTLTKMDEREIEPMFGPIAAKTGKMWADALKVDSPMHALSNEEYDRTRSWFLELYDLIEAQTRALRYGSILRAKEMYISLRQSGSVLLRDDDQISDVLNAAWLYRLNAGGFNAFEFDQIGSKAFAMCESIANRL